MCGYLEPGRPHSALEQGGQSLGEEGKLEGYGLGGPVLVFWYSGKLGKEDASLMSSNPPILSGLFFFSYFNYL